MLTAEFVKKYLYFQLIKAKFSGQGIAMGNIIYV